MKLQHLINKSAYIKYRREEKMYEIFDEETNRSYWIKKTKKTLELFKMTRY